MVTHIILGLPEETPETAAKTTADAVAAGTDGVKFHLLHVLRGTDMEKEYAYRRSEKAASGKRPVNVQFPKDGQVDVRDDGDGYHEADIQ